MARPIALRRPSAAPFSPRLTKAAFARWVGVQPARVSQWIASGVITSIGSDGFVDAAAALSELDDASVFADPTSPAAAGNPLEGVIGRPDGSLSLDEAQRLDANLKAHLRMLEVRTKQGELVDRALAERFAFEAARTLRDSFLGLPARIAAVLAAELGADPGKTLAALEREIRAHLTSVPQLSMDWGKRAGH